MKESKLSFIGIWIGSVALILAFSHFWLGPFSPQPTLEQSIAEKAVAIKKATVAALKGQKVENQQQEQKSIIDIDKLFGFAVSALGGLAIIFGILGYAKKEPMRCAGGAAILGTSAIVFQLATLALGAIILVILISAVLSNIGLS